MEECSPAPWPCWSGDIWLWFQEPENNTQAGLLASSSAPSSLGCRLSSLIPQLGLVFLLLAELRYLTTRFDTEILQNLPSVWAQLLGWTPQMLRLVIAIAGP